MIIRNWFSGMRFIAGLTMLCLPLIGQAAGYESNWLEVRVMDKQSGNAVREASVCVGTGANANQFGARRTGDDGAVRFENLLSNSLVVRVSKRGYQGREQQLEALTQARVLVLKLAPGGGGPRCDAPSTVTAADSSPGLVIEGVSVRKDPDGPGILVSVKASGPANQVRIGEQPDFSGSDWRELRQPVAHAPSDGEGAGQIYVQVRRHVQAQGATIEVVSPVERVKYRP